LITINFDWIKEALYCETYKTYKNLLLYRKCC